MVGWGEGLEQAATFPQQSGDARPPDDLDAVLTTSSACSSTAGRCASRAARTIDYYVVYVNMVQRNTVPAPVRQAMATTAGLHGDGERRPVRLGLQGPFQISSQRDVRARRATTATATPTARLSNARILYENVRQ